MTYKPSKLETIFGGDLYRPRKFLRIITSFFLALVFIKPWRLWLRDKVDDFIFWFNKGKVAYFITNYPQVRSEAETIEKLVTEKLSIARYGDGEFNMCLGRHKSFQVYDDNLVSRLKDILASNDPKVLIGINTIKTDDDVTRLWRKFIIRRGNRVLNLLNKDRTYESSTITTIFPKESKAFQAHIDLLKSIWLDRKAVFVVGKNSRFFFEEELFENIKQHKFIYGPAKNAFSQYDELMQRIEGYDKDWLIMISLGPTATVMAYDLAQKGYQAIDLGQTPSKYHMAKYGTLYPEDHHLAKP